MKYILEMGLKASKMDLWWRWQEYQGSKLTNKLETNERVCQDYHIEGIWQKTIILVKARTKNVRTTNSKEVLKWIPEEHKEKCRTKALFTKGCQRTMF